MTPPRRRWVSSTPGFQPSITQKVRTALIDSGREDLVDEIFTDGMAELEERLHRAERDIRLLQNAEQERITKSGVWTIVKGKLDAEAVNWMKWGVRASVGALIAGLVTAVGFLLRFWWTSTHSH